MFRPLGRPGVCRPYPCTTGEIQNFSKIVQILFPRYQSLMRQTTLFALILLVLTSFVQKRNFRAPKQQHFPWTKPPFSKISKNDQIEKKWPPSSWAWWGPTLSQIWLKNRIYLFKRLIGAQIKNGERVYALIFVKNRFCALKLAFLPHL